MQKYILQFIYSIILRLFLKIILGVKVSDTKFLLKEDQFIIVANHNSHLDAISLMTSIPRKIIHLIKPIAAKDYFGRTKMMEKFSNYFINTVLIDRKRDKENPKNDPINKMINTLDNGFSLILFPEGTRGLPEKEQPLKPGIGILLSQRPHIKYIPVYLSGMGKALPKGKSMLIPFNSSITFGVPTSIKSKNISEIVTQIENDFNNLKA